MNKLWVKISRAENFHAEHKSVRSAVMLIIRYWQYFMFSNDRSFLNKAYHTAVTMRGLNPASVELYFTLVFLEIQLNNYERAEDLIFDISVYKNFFKQYDPFFYTVFIYLSAVIDINGQKKRQIKKKMKMSQELDGAIPPDMYLLLLAALEIEQGNFEAGYEYLAECYERGGCSVFMYVYMYRLFVTQTHVEDTRRIFYPFMCWSINVGLNLELVLDYYKETVLISLNSVEKAKKLYANYSFNWLLKYICDTLIALSDYSETGYNYLKQAELKQLELKNLDLHLMVASYLNKKEDIRRYTMEIFLKRRHIEQQLKAFSYHLIVTNVKLNDLAEPDEILSFAESALRKREKGRYYNSLYAYLVLAGKDISDDVRLAAEDMLEDYLFTYEAEIKDTACRYVWIYEDEIKDRRVFKITEGRVRIKAVSDAFTCVCMDAGQINMLEIKPVFRKMIENADAELYIRFISRRQTDPDLYIGLAKLMMDGGKPNDTEADVLNTALSYKHISQGFRMRLAATLGNLLAGQNRYDKAIAYYNVVDVNYLSDRYIEQMLAAFVSARDYKKAVSLIVKKSHCISDRSLFHALRNIAGDKSFHAEIADAAYELLLKSWYDKNLIDIVLKHYNGSQGEWLALAGSLNGIQATDASLDEKILTNSIWMHMPGAESQKVFLRMTESSPDSPVVKWFVYYLIYEIIINDFNPEYETIAFLEDHFCAHPDKYLAYALFHYYMEKPASTPDSNGIIKQAIDYMEEDGILLPAVVKLKDKSSLRPYILKNQPFVYRTLPGRNVYLNYRFDSEDEFFRRKMLYMRYGLYMAILPVFYGEKVVYYFSEEIETSSITTTERDICNMRLNIMESIGDEYFVINNALIYEHMFKYDQVEKAITDNVQDVRMIKAALI